ncbi:MAG: phage terminase large subunit [Methylobacter sp.]
MAIADIGLPAKLIPVFQGEADVRGAYGGRGSGKTRSFAKMAAIFGYRFGMRGIHGQILCARQFMNSLDDSSLEECKRAIQDEPWLLDYYEIGDKFIKSRDGRIAYTFAGLERNISSIKSKGRILLCWVDEAEAVNETAWEILIPTLREEGANWNAELWATWNPARKGSPTDKRFRDPVDPRYRVAELNWRDNPKFPAILERQRQRDLVERTDQYDHIWEGGYKTAMSGAYFAQHLAKARADNRIGLVAQDPLLPIKAFWDIGGTGAKADACSIWIAQFVGREVRVIDYYEAIGQPLNAHVSWMQSRDYQPQRCQIYLPHDGVTHDRVFDVTYESELRRAGYYVTIIKNQGAGAAMQRIEALRKLFPSMRFDAERCSGGIDALGWYHEKRDETRNIGLGPDHDWSSHAADSAGLMAVVAEDIFTEVERRPVSVRRTGSSAGGWMG